MTKVLFFPHLQMQSGHHQAAEALMDLVRVRYPDAEVKKIDLLSETNRLLEKVIKTGYLQWIKLAPGLYSKAYKKLYFSDKPLDEHYIWHQPLFLHKLKQLLRQEQPDLIFCTHSLPSCMLSKLKMAGHCDVPVVNVYTDFFVHDYWGHGGIDAHFLPTAEAERQLSDDPNVPGQLFVTGIPVHRKIRRPADTDVKAALPKKPTILLAGGNSGLGCPAQLYRELREADDFHFLILCGHNQRLYRKVKSWNLPHVQPLPYIALREEMDILYDQADALVTKPGGVTVSEALRKRIPMFIHSALPGQEEMNLETLVPKGLVERLQSDTPLAVQLRALLADELKLAQWRRAMDRYAEELSAQSDDDILAFIEELLPASAVQPADQGKPEKKRSFATT